MRLCNWARRRSPGLAGRDASASIDDPADRSRQGSGEGGGRVTPPAAMDPTPAEEARAAGRKARKWGGREACRSCASVAAAGRPRSIRVVSNLMIAESGRSRRRYRQRCRALYRRGESSWFSRSRGDQTRGVMRKARGRSSARHAGNRKRQAKVRGAYASRPMFMSSAPAGQVTSGEGMRRRTLSMPSLEQDPGSCPSAGAHGGPGSNIAYLGYGLAAHADPVAEVVVVLGRCVDRR